jgi:phenylacetic acid degradation operon negative regulatory protein
MRRKRQLDDPRALRDAASGAVIFALSLPGADVRPLPGPVVIRLLEAIGISEPTARAAMLRMRRAGWLLSRRRGPVAEYWLSAPARDLAAVVVAPVAGQRPGWTGRFYGLLFSVPESDRAYRDALRRAAVLAGFGLLRAGLLVAADERRWSRIEGLVASAPASSRLLRVELVMTLDAARSAAAEAWPLASLGNAYRALAAEMQQAMARHRAEPPTGPAAVRLMWEAMAPISGVAIDDPCLPAVLLPDDWPTSELAAALEAVAMVIDPGLQEYLGSLRAEYAR